MNRTTVTEKLVTIVALLLATMLPLLSLAEEAKVANATPPSTVRTMTTRA